MRAGDARLVDARLLRYHGAGPRRPGAGASARDLEAWEERVARWREVQEGETERLGPVEAASEPPDVGPHQEPLCRWSAERRDAYLVRLCRAEGIEMTEALRRWEEVVNG